MAQNNWWDDAVGYEVYIRSYADGNADGIGDFAGLTERLDHIADLGADLVWVTPFYPSPMVDFGYDISDFTGVDERFGALADAERCIERAHELGLRVVFDLVPNHTSDQHPWFRSAIGGLDAPHRDWYLWRDPAPDGGPPNNWVSHFGGPAWTLDEASGQYYCHLFLPEQPDLNWRNPAVVEAFDDVLRFWLERGVDGFRIDVTQGLVKDETFRSNPELRPLAEGMDRFEQWDSFVHRHDISQPETLDVFRRWRTICREYDAVLIGETYVLDAADLRPFLEPHDGIDIAFWFQPFHIAWDPVEIRSVLADPYEAAGPHVGWVVSSHDDPRAPTRFGGGTEGAERALGLFMLMVGMPGLPFLYQGDELGLGEIAVPPDRWVDPVVFRTGVATDNRDGRRTPMPWAPGPNLGFTDADEPWLPMGDRTDTDTAAVQAADPISPLARTRALLTLRRELAADLSGTAPVFGADGDPAIVWFDRGPFRFALNTADVAVMLPSDGDPTIEYRTLPAPSDDEWSPRPGAVPLRPREGVVIRR